MSILRFRRTMKRNSSAVTEPEDTMNNAPHSFSKTLALAVAVVFACLLMAAPAAAQTSSGASSLVQAPDPTPTPEIDDLTAEEPDEDDDLPLKNPETPEPTVSPDDEEIDELTEPAPVTVIVRERFCPEDVLAIAGDIDALADACPAPMAGAMFLLNQFGVTSPNFGDGSGDFVWIVSIGGAYIGENQAPDLGEPIVYCRDDIGNSPWVRYGDFPDPAQPTIAVELGYPGAAFLCSWFHTPEPGTLTLKKWDCPETIDRRHEEVDYYLTECDAPMDGISFRVKDGLQAEQRATENGEAVWTGLAQTEVQVEESIPGGYGRPVVFCASNADVAFSQYEVSDGIFTIDMSAEPGLEVLCHVFNIEDQGKVSLFKWICPEGLTAESEDQGDYYDTCEEVGDGISFTLEMGDFSQTQVFVKGAGWISWDGLGVGTATIREEIPFGFVQPVVFCAPSYYPGDSNPYELIPTDHGAFELSFEDTYLAYSCHLYNIRGDADDFGGTLTLTKYTCPTGLTVDGEPDEGFNKLGNDCPETTDGVEFTLDLGDGHAPVTGKTGDDGPGKLVFEMSPGTYSEVALTEETPIGTTKIVVFCQYDDGPFALDDEMTGTTVSLDLEPGTNMHCLIYNLTNGEDEDTPGDDDDSGGDDDAESGDGNGDGTVVVQLPNTGAGAAHPSGANLVIRLMFGAIVLAAGLRLSRRDDPA
jgi:hypothetical protein